MVEFDFSICRFHHLYLKVYWGFNLKIIKRSNDAACTLRVRTYVLNMPRTRFGEPCWFFFLKMLLSVLLLKRKTRLGERSSSALLHFAAGGGHPLSREVFHSGSLSVRELPQPTLLPKPPNDSYYAKGPCYPLGVSHGTVLNKYTIVACIWKRSSTKYNCYGTAYLTYN